MEPRDDGIVVFTHTPSEEPTMSILHDLVHSLRNRQRELVAWLQHAPASEQALRFGPLTPAKAPSLITSLNSALERAGRNELGKCTVCHETVDAHLLQMDFDSSVCLEHLSEADRSRLEGELELATKVQRALLPHALPAISGWDVTAFSQPASIVGGDYFDFIKFGDGAHGLLIADVMGKGMPASMLMANLQASMRILIPESNSPQQVVERVNRLFRHNITLTKFVSLFVGHLDPDTGTLTYVNAGHNPPVVVPATAGEISQVMDLPPSGPAIGLVKDAAFETRQARIDKGSLVLLYTDGFVEGRSPSGEEFGSDRLVKSVAGFSGSPVHEIAARIQHQLQEFTNRAALHDDATLILLRRRPDG